METKHKEMGAIPNGENEKARNLELVTETRNSTHHTYCYANPWPFEFPHGEDKR